MASVVSVTIEIAEKKKLTLLFRLELHTPGAAPQNASTGWHIFAIPRIKTTVATMEAPMRPNRVHVKRRRASATRMSVTQILDLIGTVQAA